MRKWIRELWEDESGIGVVELVLILVVIIGLVIIFKNQLKSLIETIFGQIQSQTNSLF